MYDIGAWKVKVCWDIEIYAQPGSKIAELIPHSQYGYRFKQNATLAEKSELLDRAGFQGYTFLEEEDEW